MANEGKKRTTVYLTPSFLSFLKKNEINLTRLLNDVVFKAILSFENEEGLILEIQKMQQKIADDTLMLGVLEEKLRAMREDKGTAEKKERERQARIVKMVKEGGLYINAISDGKISSEGWKNLTEFLQIDSTEEAKLFIHDNLQELLEMMLNESEE